MLGLSPREFQGMTYLAKAQYRSLAETLLQIVTVTPKGPDLSDEADLIALPNGRVIQDRHGRTFQRCECTANDTRGVFHAIAESPTYARDLAEGGPYRVIA